MLVIDFLWCKWGLSSYTSPFSSAHYPPQPTAQQFSVKALISVYIIIICSNASEEPNSPLLTLHLVLFSPSFSPELTISHLFMFDLMYLQPSNIFFSPKCSNICHLPIDNYLHTFRHIGSISPYEIFLPDDSMCLRHSGLGFL